MALKAVYQSAYIIIIFQEAAVPPPRSNTGCQLIARLKATAERANGVLHEVCAGGLMSRVMMKSGDRCDLGKYFK